MPHDAKNDFTAIAVTTLVAAISWILATIWSEYSDRSIISYSSRIEDGQTVFRVQNESFLQSALDIKLAFVCESSPMCFEHINEDSNDYVHIRPFAPLAPIMSDESKITTGPRTVEVALTLIPRSKVDIFLRTIAEPEKSEGVVDIYYVRGEDDNGVLIVESGLTVWVMGHYPMILFVTGLVAAILLAFLVVPSLFSAWPRKKTREGRIIYRAIGPEKEVKHE